MTDRLQVTGDDGRVWEATDANGGVWECWMVAGAWHTKPRGLSATRVHGAATLEAALLSEVVKLRAAAAEYDKTHTGVVNGYLDRIAELKADNDKLRARSPRRRACEGRGAGGRTHGREEEPNTGAHG